MPEPALVAAQLREDAIHCWGIRRRHNLVVAADCIEKMEAQDTRRVAVIEDLEAILSAAGFTLTEKGWGVSDA